MDIGKMKNEETSKCALEDEKDFEYYNNWFTENEERCKKCLDLESELEKYKLFETKFEESEVEKLALVNQCKVLRKKNEELTEKNAECGIKSVVQGVVDLMLENDEEDKVFQIMAENKILECEKKRAENEVDVLKERVKELEEQNLWLQKENLAMKVGPDEKTKVSLGLESSEFSNDKDGLDTQIGFNNGRVKRKAEDFDGSFATPGRVTKYSQLTGTPFIDTPCRHSINVNADIRGTLSGSEALRGFRAKKKLAYGKEGSLCQKLAPSTPVGVMPNTACLINISDSDDELNGTKNSTLQVQGNSISRNQKSEEKKILSDQSSEEDMDDCEGSLPFSTTPKRKRASNIVTSDSDNDDDDNIPICKSVKITLQEPFHELTDSHLNDNNLEVTSSPNNVTESVTTPRRRLVERIQCAEEGSREEERYAVRKKIIEDEKPLEESGSDSESESLGDFIVDNSDVSYMSDNSDVSDRSDSTGSENLSDGNVDYEEIISALRRKRGHESKWEFEGDMLSAFGKDPEVCMKAVCALYRQQTSDEKSGKEVIYLNRRGFSKFDAARGTILAEFLTDGNQYGDVKKSVKELKEFDPNAVELCRDLATRYSKQLFEIYVNEEDPFFLPS